MAWVIIVSVPLTVTVSPIFASSGKVTLTVTSPFAFRSKPSTVSSPSPIITLGAVGAVVSVAVIVVGSLSLPASSVAVAVMVSPSTNGVSLVSTVKSPVSASASTV